MKIQTTTQLVNNKLIQSLTTDSPQLPVSALTVALNGGKTTGVFQNRSDLCFNRQLDEEVQHRQRVRKADGLERQGDRRREAGRRSRRLRAECDQRRVSRPTGTTPKLTVTTRRHPDSPKMKELTVTLGSNLSLVRSKLDNSSGSVAALGAKSFEYVDRHTLKVTGLPSGGASRVTPRLRDGATASASARFPCCGVARAVASTSR